MRTTFLVLLFSLAALTAQAQNPFPGPSNDFNGVARYTVPVGKEQVTVLAPKEALPGRPWVLAFSLYRLNWDAVANMTRTELALVEKGFHVVSLSLGNTFGAPNAIKRWDPVYDTMTETYGLAKKPALMGLSREGLAIARWAAQNPGKVSCLYMDKAVCDIKSWPGGKLGIGTGSPNNWKSLQKHYEFASEQAAIDFKANPVDLAAKLAKDGVAIIYHAGGKDPAVPYSENGAVMEAAYAKHGGTFELVMIADDGHHPHGLADPKPVVDFLLTHAASGDR